MTTTTNPNEKPRHRKSSFFSALVLRLQHEGKIMMHVSEIPESYRSQPFNLAWKLQDRAGIRTARIAKSTQHPDHFIIWR